MCVQVLKDPGKPQGKGNFWAVEVSRVPLELLKRQNTAVSRQDETVFAQDLAPYILQGGALTSRQDEPAPGKPVDPPPRRSSPTPDELYRPKLDSSFAIDSLLHSLRPAEPLRGRGDGWVTEPDAHSPCPRYLWSNRSASASSASPASSSSSSSDDDWRGITRLDGRKRATEPGHHRVDGYDNYFPPHKLAKRGLAPPPWELPTSYAKYTPPNAVAPPSMRFNPGPFVPLGSVPFYGHHIAPGHFGGHSYWPLLPGGHVSLQAPPLLMDLDSMLQSVPPNKSVFDLHQQPSQYGSTFSKYS